MEHPVRATFLPGAQNENIETRKALPGGAALLLLLELLFQLGDEFVDAPGSFLVRRQSGRFLISGDLMLELLLVAFHPNGGPIWRARHARQITGHPAGRAGGLCAVVKAHMKVAAN